MARRPRWEMTQEQAVLSVFYDAPGECLHRDTIYDKASEICHFGIPNPQDKADRALHDLVIDRKIERCVGRPGWYRLLEQRDRQRLPGF